MLAQDEAFRKAQMFWNMAKAGTMPAAPRTATTAMLPVPRP